MVSHAVSTIYASQNFRYFFEYVYKPRCSENHRRLLVPVLQEIRSLGNIITAFIFPIGNFIAELYFFAGVMEISDFCQ